MVGTDKAIEVLKAAEAVLDMLSDRSVVSTDHLRAERACDAARLIRGLIEGLEEEQSR